MDPSEPPSDAALADAWRRGDEGAAAEIVRRHAGAIARYLYGCGAAPADMEDLLQEALFRGFQKLEGWRGQASLRSWLCTIAGNLLKDQYRKHRGRSLVSIAEDHAVASADPHGEAAARETEEQLQRGLAALPRLQRETFLLRAQQGADYEEIANVLGTTPGAARVHYHHAVRRLKEMLA